MSITLFELFNTKPATCRFCGKQNLFWYETQKGWKLFSVIRGKIEQHDCRQPQPKSGKELFGNLDEQEGIRNLELDDTVKKLREKFLIKNEPIRKLELD